MPPLSNDDYTCSDLFNSPLYSSLTSLEDFCQEQEQQLREFDDESGVFQESPLEEVAEGEQDRNHHYYELVGGGPLRAERSVRFAESPEIMETLHLNNMTEDEKHDYWLSREEMRAIKMDCTGLLGMLEDGLHDLLAFDDEDLLVCLRGLEQYSGERSRLRTATRQQMYMEIFKIQESVLLLSHNDRVSCTDEMIAKVSMTVSESLRLEAVALGRSDALAAGITAL